MKFAKFCLLILWRFLVTLFLTPVAMVLMIPILIVGTTVEFITKEWEAFEKREKTK